MAKKFVVASGKGGVGKSSVTAGLCYALSDMGCKVLAVDADVGLRSLDIILKTDSHSVFDWGDVIRGNCLPEQALSSASGNICVLAAPMRFSPEYTAETVRAMIDKYDKGFDFIFADAPAGISEGFRLACAMADEGLIISTPDGVCVRGAEAAGASAEEEGIKSLRMIINRFNRKGIERKHLLNIDDTIDFAGVRLIGVVPEDIQVLFCFTGGKPLPKRSDARKAFARIAKRLTGEKSPLSPAK
ncbi:MAG: septum site-determining protein MinD [Clostridiales bacterium]|jgi:septum site-determining protein MinD|nr:septum site-determining protein MinD [Clostridiales bacterium]